MHQVFGWMTLVVLSYTAGAAVAEEKPDARLQEAQTAFDQAKKLRDAGKYVEAIVQGEHALALREEVLGGTHPDVARCLNMLGELHIRQSNLAKAEPLLQRALAMMEEALGKDHPDVAYALNNLAHLYYEQGLYTAAEQHVRRARDIIQEVLGKDHPDVARSLNILATVHVEQGLYAPAEPLLQQALAIWEGAQGKNHPNVARALSNLARLYKKQGLYARAELLYQRALAIMEEALGKNHSNVAQVLNNLAALYVEQKRYTEAEQHYERARAVLEEGPGKNHTNVAQVLNNLAVLYVEQGLYTRAEPLLQQALAIWEEAPGKNHPRAAYPLSNLAEVYANQGLYARARPLLERALVIAEAFGNNHPLVAISLNSLGELNLAQHRLADALPLFVRSFAMTEQRLRMEALDFSEVRLANFLQLLRTDEERLYALLRAHPENADVRSLALTAALLLKGRSAEEMANTSRIIYRSLGAEDRGTFEQLRDLRTQFAALSLQGPDSLPSEEYQQRLKALAEEGDALEAELAKRSAPLRAQTMLPSSADIVEHVAAALPRDGALVEFIAYADRPLVPVPGMPKAKLPSQPRYLALVLLPNAEIRAIDLGPATEIDGAALRLREALANRSAAFQTPAQHLYRLAFQPLLPLLGGTRRLFLSPDGQLGMVPFAALHDGQGFLIETFDFTYLTSGRDLLPRSRDVATSSSVVVLADPDFSPSLSNPPASAEEASAPGERSAQLERFLSMPSANLAEQFCEPLPGTRQEAESIQRLIPQAQLFLGAQATKEQLLHVVAPGVLHLATHGFFLENTPVPGGSRTAVQVGELGEDFHAPRPPDPLLRSGLVLAGPCHPIPTASGSPKPQPDSTLVTALELASLNLWGTQLVVLSACDTGRGEVKLGQGVYGLRRALVVAGAETVVMSLWKVDDKATSELMEGYYRNLLVGESRAAALRKAMRELRRNWPNPHYWAPFIALGRDAPLRL